MFVQKTRKLYVAIKKEGKKNHWLRLMSLNHFSLEFVNKHEFQI